MEGFLLVDKPCGWTSFDVVGYVRKEVAKSSGVKSKQIKVGHAGTLDPFASGLLILFVGRNYTTRAGEFLKLDKTYSLNMELGCASTTGDPEGVLERVAYAGHPPSLLDIEQALKQFTGAQEQTPPTYSAIKVNGVRAYKLAREHKPVELSPRKITVYGLGLDDYTYPELKLMANVSSGTYIRSLVEDIGIWLGTKAYTKELRRISIAGLSIDQAVRIDQINEHTIASMLLATL